MSSYHKNMIKLFSGNIVAQLIVFAGVPFLVLFYSPEQMGKIGLGISVISIVSVLIVLRLDAYLLAVRLPVLTEATNMSVKVSCFQFVLLSIVLYLSSSYIEKILEIDFTAFEYIVMLLGALLASFSFLYNSFFSRQKDFGVIVSAGIWKALILVSLQIGLGAMGILKGLWFAEIGSRIAQCFKLFGSRRQHENEMHDELQKGEFLAGIKPFIIFTTFASLVSTLASYLPVMLMPSVLTLSLAGIYFFATQIVFVPASMFAQSISKVFASEFISLPHAESKTLFYKTFLSLMALSGIGTLIAVLLLPLISVFIPERWGQLNDILDLVIIAAWPVICISSLSQVFNLVGKQKQLVLSELLKLVIMLSCFIYLRTNAEILEFELRYVVKVLVAASYTGYLVQFLLMIYLVSRKQA